MSKTWTDYIGRYFPGATDEFAHDILWERTCFPFGRKAQIKRNIQKLPRAFRLSKKTGLPLCDMCSNLVADHGKYMCVRCQSAINQNIAAHSEPTHG